jgi:hypothetical protein
MTQGDFDLHLLPPAVGSPTVGAWWSDPLAWGLILMLLVGLLVVVLYPSDHS